MTFPPKKELAKRPCILNITECSNEDDGEQISRVAPDDHDAQRQVPRGHANCRNRPAREIDFD
jgi:hypothetical protein